MFLAVAILLAAVLSDGMEAAGHKEGEKEEGGKGTSELLNNKMAAVHEPRISGDSAEAVKHNPHGRVQALQQAKQSKQTKQGSLAGKHSAVHKAAVEHAKHKKTQQLMDGKPVKLPIIPKSPPVCSPPPAMRFCMDVDYPVYRPSEEHTFAQLDFDSHAVFKKIVPHMRISERHFELPVIQGCRDNFRTFLCRRNFPKCCHVGLCNKYGEPEPPLDTADLIPPAAIKRQKATTVTFVNGSKSSMKVQMGRNDTVKVKMADAVCLEYVNTYTPLFDCRSNCEKLLSKDCRFMLSQDCDNLCYGVHTEQCATPELLNVATGKDSGASGGFGGHSAALLLLSAAAALLVGRPL